MLYHTEIELAMIKQQVVDLKVELGKAKEANWVARESAEASKQRAYNLEV